MTRPARFAAAVAILLAIGGSGLAVSRGLDLRTRIGDLRSEISGLQRELSGLRKQREARVQRASESEVQGPSGTWFHTWAHLVAALHETSSWSRLTRLSYRTGPVRTPAETGGEHHEMTARVEGRGSYAEIVEWVASLPLADPPLALDRLEIVAEPGAEPRFEARVTLGTALPIETPRLVALDPEGDEGRTP
mgnify:CR=1 FL=1